MDGTTTSTATKEEIILFGFEKEQCDVAFVFEGKTNTSLYCPSSFLSRISKEFQNNMVKTHDGSHYEIKAEGFGVDALTKALSFYQPRYFEYFKDSDDFKELLTIYSKFALGDLKTKIQSYLMTEHGLIANQKIMTEQHLQFLEMAIEFGFDELYDKIMDFKVGFSFTEDVAHSNSFVSRKDKYEVIKECIQRDIRQATSINRTNQTNSMTLELVSIFHFLDLFFYEDKILDYTLYSKQVADTPTSKNVSQIHSLNLSEHNEINEVLVKVEGKELFVNSIVLSDNSPVFKAMLNSTFKEGLENVIELPGKRAEDIIELFTSLIHGKKRTEHDAFRLLPLCREYQIDWLQDLIQEQLIKLEITSDRIRLKYLNLSHDMDFLKGEEHFVNSLSESFILLQRYKEFNDLKDEAKLLVALRRIWFIHRCICIQKTPSTLTYLFDEKLGLVSIFKNVSSVTFQMNTIEMKMISKLNNDKCTSCNGSGERQQTESQPKQTYVAFGSNNQSLVGVRNRR